MKRIILIVATILLTVACGKDEDEPKTPTVNNEPFTFLKIGNEWEYGVYNSGGELISTYKYKLVLEENGYFYVERTPAYELVDLTLWWRTDDNAWHQNVHEHLNGNDGIPYITSYIILPKKCYVGQKFNRFSLDSEEGLEIVSVSETVIVPAGIFHNCIKVISRGAWWEYNYFWYHKDYGIIMTETHGSIGGSTNEKLISTNF